LSVDALALLTVVVLGPDQVDKIKDEGLVNHHALIFVALRPSRAEQRSLKPQVFACKLCVIWTLRFEVLSATTATTTTAIGNDRSWESA
jgi:hypothetical protein